MPDVIVEDLAYQSDSTTLFDKVVDESWSIFLDSNKPNSIQGRYDIIVARPRVTIISKDKKTQVQTWSETFTVPDNPFAILNEQFNFSKCGNNDLPFIGGAMGYFSYDLGRQLEKLPSIANNDLALPDMAIGIYSWAILTDHKKKQTFIIGDKSDPNTRRNWNDLKSLFSSKVPPGKRAEFKVKCEVASNMTKQYYSDAFIKIKNYINEGDCYQVNLAQRFSAEVEGDPWLAYLKLRNINPSPFGAYMNFSDYQILSNSPERFLSVTDDKVQTKPIKGTRPRSEDKNIDQSLLQELSNSKKDQAENVMIVDLLRNDISKNCALNSVQVPNLFDIESFPNVHHMVSTVTGMITRRPLCN